MNMMRAAGKIAARKTATWKRVGESAGDHSSTDQDSGEGSIHEVEAQEELMTV